MRVSLRNVTSVCLHWHTVADWRADVVLNSETRLTAVAQQVLRAQAGASGWQPFWGAPLESPGRGRRGMGCTGRGGGNPGPPGHHSQANSPPKGALRNEAAPSPNPCGTPPVGATSWWAWVERRIPCTPKWRTVSRASHPLTGLFGTTPHGTWRVTGPPRSSWGGSQL